MLVFMHMYAYRCWLTSSQGLVVLKTLCVQVSGSAFSKRLCPSTWVVDENLFTFAVSTLVSSYLEHSPNAERLHIPPCCVEPKKHWQAWAAFMGALGGKRGSTRCELKRPSFGCLTNCLNGMGRCSFSPTFTDRFIFASRFSRSVFISLSPIYIARCERKVGIYELVKNLFFIHGHRTLKAPHPVRSAQLTRVPPS